MSDTIGATVGEAASHVAVGKDIKVSYGASSQSVDKLDEIYRLLYETRTDVAICKTWLLAMTVGLAVAGVMGLVWLM